ncbi:hypothetical protein FPZ41_04330 [Streptomyces sp. K1PN6]|uniref:Uncharacterized protein n=1 Tax=Streptomyces acidicola TaxID=2596892 RepID=A0A5N8WKU9_9ACTN|nr:hypothetical protein [Streptomyces acidicola]
MSGGRSGHGVPLLTAVSVRNVQDVRCCSPPSSPWLRCRECSIDCRLPTADCRLPTADCRLPTADCRLPTADCRLPTAG